MKHLKDIAKAYLPSSTTPKMVALIAVVGGWKTLPQEVMSNTLQCLSCEGKEHYAPFVDPMHDKRRVWICAKSDCVTSKSVSKVKATTTPPIPQRALVWPLFCEINGIGDIYHDVSFDKIEQSPSKVDYLRKFADKPRGIIFMQGEPGTGKSYSSLGVCELFTRKNTSCVFSTQKQMLNNWLETFKADKVSNYIPKVMNCNLLVIDDFGVGDVSPGFMGFFMDLINTRMQWTDRGTIITTNLNPKKFNDFCGEALCDRIMTGQQFKFTGTTRRKQQIL